MIKHRQLLVSVHSNSQTFIFTKSCNYLWKLPKATELPFENWLLSVNWSWFACYCSNLMYNFMRSYICKAKMEVFKYTYWLLSRQTKVLASVHLTCSLLVTNNYQLSTHMKYFRVNVFLRCYLFWHVCSLLTSLDSFIDSLFIYVSCKP